MMQNPELVIDPDPSRHFRSVTMGTNPRSRKCSLDHYSNKLLLDRNGNNTLFHRLASLSEDDNEASLNNTENNGVQSDVTTEETWKKAFINQIQNLLKDVNVNQKLSEKVYDEIMDKATNSDNNMNAIKTRRSSCFTLTSTVYPKRRSSVVSKNMQNNNDTRGRRMSHAGMASLLPPTSGRRSSVAYPPSYGRRSSCTNNNFLANQPSFLRQRRKSSAKPLTLNVTKVSSVQKQLHKIYKRRRRKDRASVNLDDVKSALRGPDYKGEFGSEPEADNSDNGEHANENKSPEVWEDVPDDSGVANNNAEPIKSIDIPATEDEATPPAPRRRDSTQMRAFELSRRLRQRRRGKRQVSADF